MHINPLPNNRILDVTELKAFADDKSNVAKMTISLFDKAENTVGKGKKCWLPVPAFYPFPTMFCKALFFRVSVVKS